ncbi:MAG: hypothetical protein J6J43_06255 [Oscillospiraceae bacterium]|nr:hypothetical protein [Oscillospiraceae bacterium]
MEQCTSRAKQALEAVEEARCQVGRLRRTVKLLQSKCTDVGVSRYGARAGSTMMLHPEKWDALVEQQKLLEQEEEKLRKLEQQLESWIDLLPKPRWRMVLRCHYLDGMELSDVVGTLSRDTGREFTRDQVYKLHRGALKAAENLWPLS